jgi:hypothetical protein
MAISGSSVVVMPLIITIKMTRMVEKIERFRTEAYLFEQNLQVLGEEVAYDVYKDPMIIIVCNSKWISLIQLFYLFYKL